MKGYSRGLAGRIITLVKQRLKQLLSCGLTPHRLVITCCIGIAIGIMPLLVGTTALCLLIAYLLRLNQVALQGVNYLVYPLQLALFIPFFHLGDRLFSFGPVITQEFLNAMFAGRIATAMNLAGWITLKALAGWVLTAVPAALLLYLVLLATFVRRHSS